MRGCWPRSPIGAARPASDICSLLVQARFEDGSAMSDREIRDQLMTLLLAGHETTATGLAWTLDLLTRHPDAMTRAREDGDEYLRAVIAESLRLRPVVPLAGRRLTSPLQADGVDVPTGTDVTPAIWLAHTRPASFPEPYAFRPERFLGRPPSTYTWIPYGGGVRRCLGAAFAEMEMRIALGVILRRFDLRAASSRAERVARRNVTFSPRHGTRVIATPRQLGRNRASAREHSWKLLSVRTWMSAAAVAACLLAPAPATAASSRVAALQVALRAHAVYDGAVDGLTGPGTAAGVRRFQARAGLVPDGVVGPRTRRALGALGRHPVGSRPLRSGHRGWDVAALQFALETHGFPCGTVDGGFGARTAAAVRRLQAFAGLTVDGIAGPATLAALSAPPVRAPALRRPINAPIGDGYGPRGDGLPRRPRLPRPHRHPGHRRGRRPSHLRGLRRRLRPHRRPRPRQRPRHPLRPPLRRHRHTGSLRHHRHDDRASRRHRLRHRPPPPLRGHDPRSQRRPNLKRASPRLTPFRAAPWFSGHERAPPNLKGDSPRLRGV